MNCRASVATNLFLCSAASIVLISFILVADIGRIHPSKSTSSLRSNAYVSEESEIQEFGNFAHSLEASTGPATTEPKSPTELEHTPSDPISIELGQLIAMAIDMIPKRDDPLCVLEVGTADGSGTTVKLFAALHAQRASPGGRNFTIHTYESEPVLAMLAARRWEAHPEVQVVCDMLMLEEALQRYVLGGMEGPAGDEYPGVGYYERVYRDAPRRVAKR